MHSIRSVLTTLLSIGSLALTMPASASAPRVERSDSGEARIALVRVDQQSEGLKVSGELQKRFMRRGRIPGTLLISLIAADGRTLARKYVVYHRRQRNTGRAYFSADFAATPQAVRTVRLQHLWPRQF